MASDQQRFGPKQHLLLCLAVGGIGAGAGVLFVAIIAGGQIAAIGWSASFALYGKYWLFGVGAGFVLGAVLYVGIEGGQALIRRFPKLRRSLWPAYVVATFTVMIVLLSKKSYDEARQSHPTLASPGTLAEVRSSLAQQGLTLDKLSTDAQALLRQLDTSAAENANVRSQLVRTIASIQKEGAAAASTRDAAARIAEEQADSAQRLSQLRLLLAGEQPLTRRDLDAAQRFGLWQGFLVGIASSVVAAFVYSWLSKLRVARRSQS